MIPEQRDTETLMPVSMLYAMMKLTCPSLTLLPMRTLSSSIRCAFLLRFMTFFVVRALRILRRSLCAVADFLAAPSLFAAVVGRPISESDGIEYDLCCRMSALLVVALLDVAGRELMDIWRRASATVVSRSWDPLVLLSPPDKDALRVC